MDWTDSPEDQQRLKDLQGRLKVIADAEGGDMEEGKPSRWWDAHIWRCPNGHVSTAYLKSEALGRAACLAGNCRAPLALTFPEDEDGPLLDPVQVEAP